MSKLFVAFIFAAFAFNCDRIIEVVATGSDDVRSITSDSTKSLTYEPLIVIVKETQTHTQSPIPDPGNGIIPFHSIQILSEKQSNDQFSLNTEKIYFCPHETWLDEMDFTNTHDYSLSALFEKHFDKDEAHRCSMKPWYTSWSANYLPTNCHYTKGFHFREVGVVIGSIFIKEKILETGEEVFKYYEEGMDKFINQKQGNEIGMQLIEMYQVCYDIATDRTKWIIREITPWAQIDRDPKLLEEIYAQNDNNKSKAIRHRIIPNEENSFKIWEHVTSYRYNFVPVWLRLLPLIDLINERLEKYSKQVCEININLVGKYCTKLKK